ncbi:MAG: hypothetical protein D3904_15520 [Candidatus Electrothrix sp. EH2]|nr:hypothetical protein [Candidatus Electrothrix sp. EH2]
MELIEFEGRCQRSLKIVFMENNKLLKLLKLLYLYCCLNNLQTGSKKKVTEPLHIMFDVNVYFYFYFSRFRFAFP